MDEVIASMTVVGPAPCAGITLDAETLTFTGEGVKTLTANVSPDGCTDPVTWESTDADIASVANGVVTAKANGTVTITAKCGNYSAICTVYISGIDNGDAPELDETLVYSLAEPVTFDGVDDYLDTGVQPFIPPRDFTAFVEFQTDPDCTKGGNIWYCMHDAAPYAGLNLYYNGSTHLLSGQSTGTPAHNRNKFLMTYSHADNVVRYTANGVIPETGNWLSRPEATNDGVTVTENLSLGSGQQPSGNRNAFWKGTIFQCKVWDGILTAEQIASLFA